MQLQRIGRLALAGSAGAAALTTLHEGIRQLSPRAPRMDIVAMRGIARLFARLDKPIPSNRALHRIALVGDLLSNSIFYAAVGIGRPHRAPLRGAALGAVAGVAALALPPRIGLGETPLSTEHRSPAMTVGWYVAGGLIAGCVYRLIAARTRR